MAGVSVVVAAAADIGGGVDIAGDDPGDGVQNNCPCSVAVLKMYPRHYYHTAARVAAEDYPFPGHGAFHQDKVNPHYIATTQEVYSSSGACCGRGSPRNYYPLAFDSLQRFASAVCVHSADAETSNLVVASYNIVGCS